jgi:hypothetical protein
MSAFTDIPNASLAPDQYVTYDLLTALRDNTLASMWHPYDKSTIGDAGTGLFYDFGVSGAVGSATTPDFDDDYEYMIVVSGLKHTSGSDQRVDMLLTGTVAASSSGTLSQSEAASSAYSYYGNIILPWARQSQLSHQSVMQMTPKNFEDRANRGYGFAVTQKLLNATIQFSGGNIGGGKLFLYRRGVFAAS